MAKAQPASEVRIQTQGVHHITFIGADRQTSIDFWEGVLGMAFVFEQPNLDDETQNHLYFDPGDGRLITVFTSEDWKKDPRPPPTKAGSLHHIAFTVSLATWRQAVAQWQLPGILDQSRGMGALGLLAGGEQPWVACEPWICCKPEY